VLDKNTGLLWQRSGSPDPVEWSEAQGYVASLNASCHGGLRAWRLPTVNELFSLLKPFSHNRSDCVDGVFDRTRKWLWSADRRTFTSAWHVNTELGYAGWGDFTCRYTARAVCRAGVNRSNGLQD
jgi:serine/threonine-protein kinase